MGTTVGTKVFDGVNAAGVDGVKPFDMYCPLMGSGDSERLNFWKEKCEYRQKVKANAGTCYGGCKMKSKSAITRGTFAQLPIKELLKLGEAWHERSHNETIKSIADDTQYSSSTITRYIGIYCRSQNIPMRNNQKPSIYMEKAIGWIEMKKKEKLSNKQIAVRVGVSVSTVNKYISMMKKLS